MIITYYWPPAGAPGVQRWLKFIKYLPDFNIEPIVYVPSNPNYPVTDESLVDEIPKRLTIIKQPIVEPYQLASKLSKGKSDTISKGIIPEQKKQGVMERLMLFVRGNFFIKTNIFQCAACEDMAIFSWYQIFAIINKYSAQPSGLGFEQDHLPSNGFNIKR